ncbi:MAG: AraC family transcriptional regulator [Paracoccaceae bacterium]
MKASPRIVPDYEVIICPPAESFRWDRHDYPHYLAKWHYHPEYELHLTRFTSGTMMVGDHLGDFGPGCLVLTGPNLPHNWVSNLAPGEVARDRDMLIQFSPEWADRVGGFCPEMAAVGKLFADAAYGVEFTGRTATEGAALLAEIGVAKGAERVLLFLKLMDRLARDPIDRRRLSQGAPDASPAELPKELDAAMRYIMDSHADRIGLADVAAQCGLTPQTFSRLFKRQTGHTFARYMVLTRIYAACTLLTQTHNPITDICFEVGFNNIANFNRQFFKTCGRTPSEYRRAAQKIGTESRQDPFRETRQNAQSAYFEGGKV